MAQINLSMRVECRHRWLGIAFLHLCGFPFDVLGKIPGPRTTNVIATIATWLMGLKVVTETHSDPADH